MLDNLARPSAESILPEHQNTQVGDVIAMSPDGKQGMQVKDFSKNNWMLWWDNIGDSSWVWEIYPEGETCSRLVTRVRLQYRWLSPAIFFHMLIEFFDILMMRKCMLGIKRRAEAMSRLEAMAEMKIEMNLPISVLGDVVDQASLSQEAKP